MQYVHSSAAPQKHLFSGCHWKRYLISSCCILFLFFLSSSPSLAASAKTLPSAQTTANPKTLPSAQTTASPTTPGKKKHGKHKLRPLPIRADRLQIQLQTTPASPVITIYDLPSISQLYWGMLKLQPYPEGQTCQELSKGDVYSLDFLLNGNIVTHASVEANGCHGLTISNADTRLPDQDFWDLLQQAFNSKYPTYNNDTYPTYNNS